MAWKNQEDKSDLILEYVGILPVNEIDMSDNRESRPKRGKTQFLAPPFTAEAQKSTSRLA